MQRITWSNLVRWNVSVLRHFHLDGGRERESRVLLLAAFINSSINECFNEFLRRRKCWDHLQGKREKQSEMNLNKRTERWQVARMIIKVKSFHLRQCNCFSVNASKIFNCLNCAKWLGDEWRARGRGDRERKRAIARGRGTRGGGEEGGRAATIT